MATRRSSRRLEGAQNSLRTTLTTADPHQNRTWLRSAETGCPEPPRERPRQNGELNADGVEPTSQFEGQRSQEDKHHASLLRRQVSTDGQLTPEHQSKERKRKQTCLAEHARTKLKPRSAISSDRPAITWEEYYLKDSDAIPNLRRITSGVPHSRPFLYQALKFVRRLSPKRHDATATVWEIEADSVRCAVKLFRPYTDNDAESQRIRLHKPKLSLSKVKLDASPFQHELEAYERISQYCSESDRSYFPTYFGTIDIASPDQPDTALKGIVTSILTTNSNRYLYSSEVPSYLHDLTVAFRARLKTLNLPQVEETWYSEVFLERAKKLTALHKMCITHGDVKNDCFQIPHYPHDIALYDFSLAYTFTSQKPCVMNGSVRLMPLKQAADIDLRNAEIAVMEMATQRTFQAYVATLLSTGPNGVDNLLGKVDVEHNTSQELDLIIISDAKRSRRYFFPSLPSLLPFLEPAVSGKSAAWTINTADNLNSYAAIWYLAQGETEHQEFDSAVIISSDGNVLQRCGETEFSSTAQSSKGMSLVQTNIQRKPAKEKSKDSESLNHAMVAFIPPKWQSLMSQRKTLCQEIFSLVTPKMQKEVVVLQEQDIPIQIISIP